MTMERVVEDLQYITSELEDANPYQYCEDTLLIHLSSRVFGWAMRVIRKLNEWQLKRYPGDTRVLSDVAWSMAWFINSTYCPEHSFYVTDEEREERAREIAAYDKDREELPTNETFPFYSEWLA